MSSRFKINPRDRRVLEVLAVANRTLYGLEIADKAGLPRGGIYVRLALLIEAGLIASEDDPTHDGRGLPRKRYELTRLGRSALHWT